MVSYQNTIEWTWQVIFDDGGTLDEFVGGAHVHGFADIQREIDAGRRPRFLTLAPVAGRPDLRPVVVALQAGEHPIFFRRARIPVLSLAGGEPEPPYTAHCVGLRRPGQGEVGMAFVFLFPDGRVLLTTNRNEF